MLDGHHLVVEAVVQLDPDTRGEPVGGILDGFLCRPGDEDTWEEVWAEGDRGFPELIW